MKIKITFLVSLLIISVNTFCQQIGDGRAIQITDLTVPLKSGVYQSTSGLGMIPDISHGWQHLFVVRHSNDANDHQLQLSSSYSINDRLFFRKLAGGLEPMNPTWVELATRGNNAFIGNQSISGNLGIGTTTPNSRLDLGSGYGANGAKLLIYNDNTTSELSGTKCGFYMDNFTPNNLNLVFPEAASNPGLFTISAKNTSGTTLNPYFSIAGLTGNVGIGTTNPTSKLTVAGNINSREVKVTVDAGADFVFEKNYDLPSLASIENYIKENKHLPEIASAKEMKANGINLSEMNIKLLQKIEEITLYMIEQNKQIEILKNENEYFRTLSKRLTKLEKLSEKR